MLAAESQSNQKHI